MSLYPQFRYKAIVFDMDGTLINSDELVLNIYKKLTEQYKSQIPFESLDPNDVLALSYPEVLTRLYGSFQDQHMNAILSWHSQLKHQYLTIYPGVRDMLESLKNQGYKLGLLTSEMHAIAIDEMKILGIDHFFDRVIAFDDVKKPKPHPDGLIELMKVFNCQTHEIMMIGDQTSDALAAKALGIYSILVDHERSKPQSFLNVYHHVAYSAHEIMKLIKRQESLFLTIPNNRDLKIIQFTDLHLMNDEKDDMTYQLMSSLIQHEKPDFIAITGDQTMSKDAVMLYRELGQFMDSHQIPYSFVFGNHDTEGGTYQELIDAISDSTYLLFDQGPLHLGYSNFCITLLDQNIPFGKLVFMDSHIDDFFMIDGKMTWGYGVFSEDQLAWYDLKLINPVPHLIFFHIPLVELKETSPHDSMHQGDYYESPSTQGINTGFFQRAILTKQAKGMFYGHDHLNDFTYEKEGILLAYGRVSGHYDYAMPGFPKGARIITFHPSGKLHTHIVIHHSK